MNKRTARGVAVSAGLTVCLLAALPAFAGTTTVDPEWAAGEAVVVAAGDIVELTRPTARLKSITVSGTVKMSGWSTAIDAETVTVTSTGVLSPKDTFSDETSANRVYVTCADFTLEEGGKVNANSLGYRTGPASGSSTTGLGPGKGAPNGGGGGHGGRGGHGYFGSYTDHAEFGIVNDSLEAPELPGSSGGSGNGGNFPGGGAIRIDATGDVRLWGTVTADGMCGNSSNGGGSGGSVYITCRTFDGGNLISANGGFNEQGYRGAGGGGRISIRWSDRAAQSVLNPTPTISASARAWGYDSLIPDDVNRGLFIAFNQRGENGTIYLTDDSFYAKGGWSRCYGPVSFETAADVLAISDDIVLESETSVNTAKPGQEIVISGRTVALGKITSLGKNAHLTFVDCDVTAESIALDDGHLHFIGHTKLVVAGDVTVGGTGQLTVQAGETNGVEAATWSEYGAYVEVKGALTLADTAKMNVWSHDVNGGSAFFKLASMSVAEGAVVNGNTLGWGRMGVNTALWPTSSRGYGPGASVRCVGASYGGKGGSNGGSYAGDIGKVYGDLKNPTDPGSSAGKHGSESYVGGYGGGLFRAEVAGTVRVDGAISMNGGAPGGAQAGGGAGGAVNLVCERLSGGGTISANGGPGKSNTAYSGDGGGGRIAIYYSDMSAFSGLIEAKAGASGYAAVVPATDGTVYLRDVNRRIREWIGAAGDGLWTNPSNWDPAGTPVEGEEVYLLGGSVTLSGETPQLKYLEVDGTVVFSGWETKLCASNLVVKGTGVLRPLSDFDESEESNRVNVACVNFTLERGGKINASSRGYRTGPAKGSSTTGLGPGKGAPNGGGGGHGGRGGRGYDSTYADSTVYGIVCDCLEAPVQPGSSGGANGATASGGGAIRIDATGDVRLWGTVTADGAPGNSLVGGGAGGSVYITCRTFDGDNLISANGGFNAQSYRGAGGGGRIAIRWSDDAAQAELRPVPQLSVSARGWGYDSFVPADVNRVLGSAFNQRGENGTVYLTDDSFYVDGGWSNCYGNVSFGTVTGVLAISDDIAFGEESAASSAKSGQEVVITGRTVTLGKIASLGRNAHLTFVDCDVTAGSIAFNDGHLHLKGHTKLVVTGDVTVGGTGQLTVQAGETNGVEATTWSEYGAYVEVKGALVLADTAKMNVWSHDINGGSPFFRLGRLSVAEGAVVNGNTLGWGGVSGNSTLWPTGCRGCGPGTSSHCAGASYGGEAGGTAYYAERGKVYGDAKEPTDPGSSAGKHGNTTFVGGYGGGLFRAEIAGTLQLDGLITMNGGNVVASQGGGGSGGGVNIRCRRLKGAGTICANGGGGSATSGGYSGDGGGGRIAIRTFDDEDFSGKIEAEGGNCGYAFTYEAQPGSKYYKVHRGLMLLVR